MWTLLIFLYLSAPLQATAQHYSRALYPSAHRIRRGAHALLDPSFQRSVEDVNLLFEILLAGSQIQGQDHGGIQIPDEELASLRKVEKLEVICEDVLPKSLSEIRRLSGRLEQHRRPLSQQDFERTVLTLVFITQTLEHITEQNQRALWTHSFTRLFSALLKDLSSS
ncbi:protein FAM180A [Synchiropus splendidus]|uniref:protein FAM180A n=1 Tax=Synchiropus splendidus TaxID=270530 RepID=UPI00237D5E64|nr:protein FAM180A [Synchiropus splendidus]